MRLSALRRSSWLIVVRAALIVALFAFLVLPPGVHGQQQEPPAVLASDHPAVDLGGSGDAVSLPSSDDTTHHHKLGSPGAGSSGGHDDNGASLNSGSEQQQQEEDDKEGGDELGGPPHLPATPSGNGSNLFETFMGPAVGELPPAGDDDDHHHHDDEVGVVAAPGDLPPSMSSRPRSAGRGARSGRDTTMTKRFSAAVGAAVGAAFVAAASVAVVVILRRRNDADEEATKAGTAELQVPPINTGIVVYTSALDSSDAAGPRPSRESAGDVSAAEGARPHPRDSGGSFRSGEKTVAITTTTTTSTPLANSRGASPSCTSPRFTSISSLLQTSDSVVSVFGASYDQQQPLPPPLLANSSMGASDSIPSSLVITASPAAAASPAGLRAGVVTNSPGPPRALPTSATTIINEELVAREAEVNSGAFSNPARCARGHRVEKSVRVTCCHVMRKPKKATDLRTLFDRECGHVWSCARHSRAPPPPPPAPLSLPSPACDPRHGPVLHSMSSHRQVVVTVDGRELVAAGDSGSSRSVGAWSVVPNTVTAIFDSVARCLAEVDTALGCDCRCPLRPPPPPPLPAGDAVDGDAAEPSAGRGGLAGHRAVRLTRKVEIAIALEPCNAAGEPLSPHRR